MNIENRLSKLEAKTVSDDDFKVFRVIGNSDEECQAAIDRLIESGEALPTDHFFCRLIVSPPIRDEAGRPIPVTADKGMRRPGASI
jgi:hypothetical protein